MTTDTAQINVRISRPLKERGDAALERAGYSPSQAIRNLWELAANNASNPRAIQNLFEEEKTAEKHAEASKERLQRREAFRNDMNVCAKAYEHLGIKPSLFTINAPYEELRERALMERLQERGLDA